MLQVIIWNTDNSDIVGSLEIYFCSLHTEPSMIYIKEYILGELFLQFI